MPNHPDPHVTEAMQAPQGLSSADAALRLAHDGANELYVPPRNTLTHALFALLREPLFVLLFSAAGLYLLLGDRVEALALMASVGVAAAITIFQSYRTERVLLALRDLSSPRAAVVRDGVLLRIAGRELVAGDLMVIGEGDRIAADATLLGDGALRIDESLLTGESVPVERFAGEALHAATLVVAGQGRALVTATGARTQFGHIGAAMLEITEVTTPMQRDTARLARRFGLAGGALSLTLVLVYGVWHGDWIEALLRGLTLALAILPEEFPLVVTVFMALGAWRLAQQRVLTRRPGAIEALGSATVLCVDKTGTLTHNRMQFTQARSRDESPASWAELKRAVAGSVEADSFEPMDQACRTWLAAQDCAESDIGPLHRRYPLRTGQFVVGLARQCGEGGWWLAAKGAPEHVLDLCRVDGGQRREFLAIAQRWAGAGQRVLGVASSAGSPSHAELPAGLVGAGLDFRGLIAFADPLREEVPQAVAECRRAGVRILMITGDYPQTAAAIARQAGLAEAPVVVSGDQLESWTDEMLAQQLRSVHVVARATPLAKLRIVQALQRSGEVVAMTGDGVNDAPALRAAHIGVAMGPRGSDVAREAASLVLLQDDFSSLVRALSLGRRVFTNLRQVLLYILAVHVPIIALSLLPMLIGAPQLLMPIHVMFFEFVIDPACSLVFEAERADADAMTRPPRRADEHVMGAGEFGEAARQGLVAVSASLVTFLFAQHLAASPGGKCAWRYSVPWYG